MLTVALQLHPHALSSWEDPYGGPWGEAIDAEGLSRAFRSLGHEVYIISTQIVRFLKSHGYSLPKFDLLINFHSDCRVECESRRSIMYYQEFHSRFLNEAVLQRITRVAEQYDLVVTPAVEAARALGLPYVPLAVDENVFFPEPCRQRGERVVFIGRLDNRTVEDYDLFFGGIGSSELDIYGGSKWLTSPRWRRNYRGRASLGQARHLYSSARAAISCHHPDLRNWGLVTSRVFHIVASGGRILSDRFGAIEDLFGDRLDYVVSSSDVRDHLTRGGAGVEARIEDARRLVLERHTFQQRARNFLELAELD